MALDTFDFCPNSRVPETLPRDPTSAISMNGWDFVAKPTTPHQHKFKVTLYGLRWYLNATTGLYDDTTNPTINARRLEEFYDAHETWAPFLYNHQHKGLITVRFAFSLAVPAGSANSGGWLDPLEMTLIEYNPGY